MTPSFTTPDSSIRLYQQDAAEFLAALGDKSCDLILFSPPYNQKRDTKSYGLRARRSADSWLGKWRDKGYADDMPEREYQKWLLGIVRECLRVSSGMVVVNHKVRGSDTKSLHPMTLLHPVREYFWREVIWDRMGSVSMNSRGHSTSHESFYCFRAGQHHWSQAESRRLTVWHVRDEEDVWQLSPERTSDHVCPWPVTIPERFIRAYCPKGGLVCDPFSGRGTTAWACIRTERRFIGSELVRHTFDTACKLTQAEYERNEPAMFHSPLRLLA